VEHFVKWGGAEAAAAAAAAATDARCCRFCEIRDNRDGRNPLTVGSGSKHGDINPFTGCILGEPMVHRTSKRDSLEAAEPCVRLRMDPSFFFLFFFATVPMPPSLSGRPLRASGRTDTSVPLDIGGMMASDGRDNRDDATIETTRQPR
jgi:hypothetical protein